MFEQKSSQGYRYGWVLFALVFIGLSLAAWRTSASTFPLSNVPKLVPAVEPDNVTNFAVNGLPPAPSLFTEAITPSLPSLMQQPAGCGASFAQAPGSPVTVGTTPKSMATGDFNHDGKTDLAVANEISNTLTILLGNGAGGFAQAANSPITTGTTPRSVAVGDFNLDGKLDLAVGNFGANNVTILLGNGSGGFAPSASSPISAGNFPNFIAVADFNLDGKPDLAVANTIGTVTIRMGDGSGGFIALVPPVSVSAPGSIAVSDYNLDGKPDLAVTERFQVGQIKLFRGNGSGFFFPALGSPIPVSPASSSVKFGDFNLDGRPDLAVASIANNEVTILLNDVNGYFIQAPGSHIAVGTNPTSISVGDFNLDGKPDIATANSGSNDITILQGNGNGSFVTAAGSPIGTGNSPQYLATDDFNLDGKPDFAVANANSNNVTIQLNTCPAQPCSGIAFSQPVGSPITSAPTANSIAVADYNLDGKLDFIAAGEFGDTRIFLGNGNGGFTFAGSLGSFGRTQALLAEDFNLDGKLDIAVLNELGRIYIGLGNGTNLFSFNIHSPVIAGASTYSFVADDFNLDGIPDLAVADAFGYVITLLGNGTGGFSQSSDSPTLAGDGAFYLVKGNFNFDGKTDLAVVNLDSHSLTILLGNGNGGFAEAFGSPISVGLLPYSATVGDFNLDGKFDLAVANSGASNVTILLGNGIGGFSIAPNSPVAVGAGPHSILVKDINLDGKSDLVVANNFSNDVTILVGNGNSDFRQIADSPFGAGTAPHFIAIEDFNLDNKPDIAVANYSSGNVTILLNTCMPLIVPPTISCSSNITIGNSAGQNLTSVPFTVTATGIPTPTVICRVGNAVITSPHVFPVGTTTVNCTASNGVQPDASCSFTVTVNRVSGSVNDPLACTGPGNKVQATLNISNDGQGNQTVASNTTFTNLTGVPGSCVATPNIGTCTVTASSVSYSGMLPPGTTVALTYLTQVSDLASPGAQVCTNNSVSFNGGQPTAFSVCDVVDCPATGPGGVFPAPAEASDQKAGSVLIYNLYTSSTDPTRQNTRINLTNSHPQLPSFVHLFFVAEGCSVADSYVCLTANQTASFLASDLDPGTSGYLVAVAVDAIGCPTAFNHLLGDEYVKFASGHAANLNAVAFAALPGGLTTCDGNSVTTALNFDGLSYNRAPRVLALSNVGSRADGNDTLLILNRIGGNLGLGASTLSTLFGILYDDAENALSFQMTGSCQLRNSITNNFPRTAPRFETFVPAGRSGWLKVFSQSPTDIGILGAVINVNANAAAAAGAFNQGHNLHALTLSATNTYIVPIFPPGS